MNDKEFKLGERRRRSGKADSERKDRGSDDRDTKRQAPVDDDEDEDDDILSGISERGKNRNNLLFIVIGVAVVVVIVFLFIVFLAGRGGDSGDEPNNTLQPVQTQVVATQQVQPTPTVPGDLGTQDFTQNTTMTNSNVLTNPDQYIEDIYGLTTRVDYTVNRISSVADFVSYTKHRGTWGGGLELYWLDAEYKGSKYVIQVPFEYYKELDDVGIVPVRMEVLTIEGNTPTENLTVISYMCLDEEVLQDILDEQARG